MSLCHHQNTITDRTRKMLNLLKFFWTDQKLSQTSMHQHILTYNQPNQTMEMATKNFSHLNCTVCTLKIDDELCTCCFFVFFQPKIIIQFNLIVFDGGGRFWNFQGHWNFLDINQKRYFVKTVNV